MSTPQSGVTAVCPEGMKVKEGRCVNASGTKRAAIAGALGGAAAVGGVITARKAGKVFHRINKGLDKVNKKTGFNIFNDGCEEDYSSEEENLSTHGLARCPEDHKVQNGKCVKVPTRLTAAGVGVVVGGSLLAAHHVLSKPATNKDAQATSKKKGVLSWFKRSAKKGS